MNKILEKRQLSANVWRMKLEAPLIARERKAGQFVIVQVVEEFGERIPLTIGNASAEEGWIEIIFQTVGETTMKLSRREVGEDLPAVIRRAAGLKNRQASSFSKYAASRMYG